MGYTAFWIWETNGSCSVPRKVMSVNDFCVDEIARGHGIGTQMMAELRIITKEESPRQIPLPNPAASDSGKGLWLYRFTAYSVSSK